MASIAIASDDLTGYGVGDDVLIPVVYGIAAAGFLYDNWELIEKMNREIAGIRSKTRKESPSIVYELRAKVDGYYDDVRLGKDAVFLKKGDIWKIGQTSRVADRYPNNSYERKKFDQIEVFRGNKTEVLAEEKRRIYIYEIINGSLPPGNKIHR